MGFYPPFKVPWKNGYPDADGKPMAETEWHRNLMMELIEELQDWFRDDPNVCASGNLLIHYERGDKNRHVSPDVFVVRGVPNLIRPNYLIWEEGKGPEVVIELTSKTTRREDTETKFRLYRDVLRVKEYFLFDPREEYLDPPEQGYRLRAGEYRPIRRVAGRFPSQILGLHLERQGEFLRLFDPQTGRILPTKKEKLEREQEAREAAELARQESERARQESEQARQESEQARLRAEQENERLRQQLEALRQRLTGPNGSHPTNGGS